MNKNERSALCKKCLKKLNKIEADNKRKYRAKIKKKEDKLWEDFEREKDKWNKEELDKFDKN